MKTILLAVHLVVFGAAATLASDGVPSPARLSELGLSEMVVVSDQAGSEVRGQGFIAADFTFRISTTAITFSSGGTVQDGIPLNYDPATPQGIFVDLIATTVVEGVVVFGPLPLSVPAPGNASSVATVTATIFMGPAMLVP